MSQVKVKDYQRVGSMLKVWLTLFQTNCYNFFNLTIIFGLTTFHSSRFLLKIKKIYTYPTSKCNDSQSIIQ